METLFFGESMMCDARRPKACFETRPNSLLYERVVGPSSMNDWRNSLVGRGWAFYGREAIYVGPFSPLIYMHACRRHPFRELES